MVYLLVSDVYTNKLNPIYRFSTKKLPMNRRLFLTNLSLSSSGAFLAFNGLAKRAEVLANAENLTHLKAVGYGELLPAVTKNTSETFLALPKGFEYNVIGKVGNMMSDGRKTPARHDGMAAFEVRGELRVIRNHEVTGGRLPKENAGIGKANHYDETAGGGTTTLIIDPKTREIEKDFVSLSGTLINCAGGRTPWGSWISCEETTLGQTVVTNTKGLQEGGFRKPHGYCFEVSASANNNLSPVPLKAMGRFVHEAVAVDKKSGTVYLTEDYKTAGFYRFLPRRNKHLAEGGVLQMLAVKDKPNFDTRTGQKTGANYAANWVTIDNPDPEEADIDSLAVYKQGFAKGAATFARLEGCYADKNGRIYFTSTSGGDTNGGQVWLYEPHGKHEGSLSLLFESPSREILDMPDNICLKPKSDLLFICEDSDYIGEGGTPDNFMRILTPNGKIADFARNIMPNFTSSEFAGSTFSKDGKTLFLNLQSIGATFAIWGDWNSFRI